MIILSFRNQNELRRGFSLTEGIIFLGIVGFIAGAIWAAASETSRKDNLTKTISSMLQITQNMRSLFRSQSTFDGAVWPTGTDITAQMINSEVVPRALVNTTAPAQLISPWGTRIVIRVGPTLDTFDIEFQATLNTQVCRTLVAMTGGPSRDRGLVQITPSVGGPIIGAALNPLTAVNAPACTAATFTFNLKG